MYLLKIFVLAVFLSFCDVEKGFPTKPNGTCRMYCPDCKNDENEIVRPGENLKKIGKQTEKRVQKNIVNDSFGPILGVRVGTLWNNKSQILEARVHSTLKSNIYGGENGVYSIILEKECEVFQDNGGEFYYIMPSLCNTKQLSIARDVFTQHMTKMAQRLTLNCNNYKKENCSFGKANIWKCGKPIRVVRGSKLKRISKFAPTNGFRYDGIYKVVEYFPDIDRNQCIIWRFLLKRDDPTIAPWAPLKYNFFLDVADRQSKKPKMEKFQISDNIIEFIKNDFINEKLWSECEEAAELGEEEFMKKVTDMFTCVCCQDVVYLPVTTICKHHICHGCLKKCFKSDIYYCPYCRVKVEKNVLCKINHNLHAALKLIFPGYEFRI